MQLVDFIILEACMGAASSVKQRVTQILNLRGKSVKTIRHVMRGNNHIYNLISKFVIIIIQMHCFYLSVYIFSEYAGNLGDAGDKEWREMEQQHILQLVDKF